MANASNLDALNFAGKLQSVIAVTTATGYDHRITTPRPRTMGTASAVPVPDGVLQQCASPREPTVNSATFVVGSSSLAGVKPAQSTPIPRCHYDGNPAACGSSVRQPRLHYRCSL